MTYENRRYLIIPTSVTSSIDFNQVHETSSETLRLSVDGTQTFVKYEITEVTSSYTESFTDPETNEVTETVIEQGIYGRPSIYSDSYSEHTHSEILSILTGSDWTVPMDEGI